MDIREELKIKRWKKLERLDEIYPSVFTALVRSKRKIRPGCGCWRSWLKWTWKWYDH